MRPSASHKSDATVVKVADEEDWINLLIASERVSEWLDTLRWGQSDQKKQAATRLLREVQSKETYVEEARAAGAVSTLTSILRKSDDEHLTVLAAAIIAACSGHLAAGRRVQDVCYGKHIVKIQEGALGDGLGARVWVAAHCLCRHIEARPELVNGLSVLEIGSGCGLSGLLAAKLGAQQVTLTDYEESVLMNLQACMAANFAEAAPPESPKAQSSNAEETSEADSPAKACPSYANGCSLKDDSPGRPAPHGADILWDMANVSVRFLNWTEALPREDQLAIMKEDSIAGRSRGSGGPPALEAGLKYPVILGSDLIYEAYHADLVAAVISQRLADQGRAYVALAVRRQAHLDRLLERSAQFGLAVCIEQQEVDPEAVGIVGRENEYEGGFVLLTIFLAQE